jgi:ABC-type transporter Mla MlaB component
MATKDKAPGLLSKMVQFMRSPAKSGADAPMSDLDQNSELAKDALKARIAMKRSDDSIRRREFDHLRKLRNSSPQIGTYVGGARPSIFQNSTGFNSEDRALTIKKIDAIEANMSQNWAERKVSRPELTAAKSAPIKAPVPRVALSTVPQPLADAAGLDGADYDFTKVGKQTLEVPSPQKAPESSKSPANFANSGVEAGLSGFSQFSHFSNSKLVSVELVDSLGDSNLQDAAMRFADGDTAGAEAILLDVLRKPEDRVGAADPCAAALFDMYRSTNQHASFEAAALDYAQRFGRSPPEWHAPSTARRAEKNASGEAPVVARAEAQKLFWDCPPDLDAGGLQSLNAFLAQASPPFYLQWGRLSTITPAAADVLASLFEQWCAQPVTLRFEGSGVLKAVLKGCTPRGDPRRDQMWWRLRLDSLRILGLLEEFEDAAMEFCLVYELSPPCWKDPLCKLESAVDTVPGTKSATLAVAPHLPAMADSTLELSGLLVGDAVDTIAKLEGIKSSAYLRISCARLIRVDFVAASSLLNWAALRESDGCHIHFFDVPRLVAAFFNVMGISEHAKVTVHTK